MGDTVTPSPGDIGLVRITGAGGFLIRLGQALNGDGFANYEHAFTYLGDGQIIEAEPGGARIRPLSQYDGSPVVWLRCPAQYGAAVASAARGMVGLGYSAADYFALAAHRLHVPVPGLRAYVGRSNRLICSQLCDLAASLGGWHLLSRVWPGYVTPGALRKLAAQQKEAAA